MTNKTLSLHPILRGMLDAARAANRPQLCEGTPAQSRALLAASCAALGSGPEVGAVSDVKIPTRGSDVTGRLFRPKSEPRGLIVYVHGGGWVLGTLTDFDALSRTLVDRSGCTLLLVDYRLSPEFPFPAGLEDVEDCSLWASKHIEALAGNDVALMVAGDSAGANLATVAAAALRQRVPIALQLLFYPVKIATSTPRATWRLRTDCSSPARTCGGFSITMPARSCGRTRAYRRCARRT